MPRTILSGVDPKQALCSYCDKPANGYLQGRYRRRFYCLVTCRPESEHLMAQLNKIVRGPNDPVPTLIDGQRPQGGGKGAAIAEQQGRLYRPQRHGPTTVQAKIERPAEVPTRTPEPLAMVQPDIDRTDPLTLLARSMTRELTAFTDHLASFMRRAASTIEQLQTVAEQATQQARDASEVAREATKGRIDAEAEVARLTRELEQMERLAEEAMNEVFTAPAASAPDVSPSVQKMIDDSRAFASQAELPTRVEPKSEKPEVWTLEKTIAVLPHKDQRVKVVVGKSAEKAWSKLVADDQTRALATIRKLLFNKINVNAAPITHHVERFANARGTVVSMRCAGNLRIVADLHNGTYTLLDFVQRNDSTVFRHEK